MIKKLSILALAGCFALPTVASAASNADLASKIDKLTQELGQLRDQMEEQAETFEEIDEKAEGWDLASRFQFSGDIRSRMDYMSAETADHYSATDIAGMAASFVNGLAADPTMLNPFMPALSPATQAALGGMMSGGLPTTYQQIGQMMGVMTASERKMFADTFGLLTDSADYDNDTSYTTRFRLNMRVKATENIEIKARAVAYKFWGMQSNAIGDDDTGVDSPFFLNTRTFDGTAARQPGDSTIQLDRAFMNWNNIGGQPVWFSIGRRPTTDGPPAHLRQGANKRMATPVNFMDYPFDGVSLGYAYANLFGIEDMPGRIRFCYGRGFEAGVSEDSEGLNDVDFAGLSWDVLKKGNRFINIQSFAAMNIFNVPGDTYFPNPYETADTAIAIASGMDGNGVLNQANLGDIYHTAAVYMDKFEGLNYFATLGWSHTDPSGMDEMGTSLLGDSWAEIEDKDGYGVYVGVRYDLDDLGLKFGAEYNYGSEDWLAFTPGHDDMYSSKLYTRGSVYEVYGIWDLPAGEAVSKFGNAFVRLGYQHYEYDYTYSGMWLGTPRDIDELADDPNFAQFYAPLESMDQIYLTFEAWF